MIPIVLVAIGAAGAAASGAIGSRINNKIKSRKKIETQTILSGDSANYPRILICGASSAGKSSLINNVLGAQVAQVSSNGSATRGFNEYFSDVKKLRLCECEGYATGKVNEYRQRIEMFLKTNSVDGIWYCVDGNSKRLLATDEDNIKQLIELVGEKFVTVVITKADLTAPQELNDLIASVNASFPFIGSLTHSTDASYAEQTENSIKRLIERSFVKEK